MSFQINSSNEDILGLILRKVPWPRRYKLCLCCKTWERVLKTPIDRSLPRQLDVDQTFLGVIHKSQVKSDSDTRKSPGSYSLSFSVCDVCDPESRWITLPHPPGGIPFKCCITILNGQVYILGGQKVSERTVTRSVYRFDISSCDRSWKKCERMNEARSDFSVVAYGGKLWAIGGMGIQSTESYDIQKDTWSLMAPLNSRLSGFIAYVLDGEMCTQGWVFNDLNIDPPFKTTGETYNSDSNRWMITPNLPEIDSEVGFNSYVLIIIDNVLYKIDEALEISTLRSTETNGRDWISQRKIFGQPQPDVMDVLSEGSYFMVSAASLGSEVILLMDSYSARKKQMPRESSPSAQLIRSSGFSTPRVQWTRMPFPFGLPKADDIQASIRSFRVM